MPMPEAQPPPETLSVELGDLDALISRCRGLPPARLVEELRADQARRWRAGQRLPAEAYLEAFPPLAASAEDALVLIWGEVLLRLERGDTPQPVEYRERFPQHTDALTVQFDLQGHLDQDRALTLPAGATTGPARVRFPEVPGYEILGELGRGGMGVVYQARHVKLNRLVALKMLLAGGHAGAPELRRFRAEAEAVARLQYPHIVQIFEVGEHDGLPYLALEFCGGGSLADRLNGTPLPPDQAASLIETLARAVQAIHQAGVVHRDIKPANILLREEATTKYTKNTKKEETQEEGKGASGRDSFSVFRVFRGSFIPKITDFGLAKWRDAQTATRTGSILGTPAYMAPEQARGQTSEVGPAVDIWALGVLLYECLTGRPPFQGATPSDIILRVLSDEPAPPRKLNAAVPRDLETIALKCLRKPPATRYASAAELADDLRRFREGEPIKARPLSLTERLWRRRRILLAVGLALLVVVPWVLVWVLVPRPENGSTTPERPVDALQPGSHWSGVFRFQGAQEDSGDVSVTITERAGERFRGEYMTEGGNYKYLIEGTAADGKIRWRFTKMIKQATPTDIDADTIVEGSYQGERMDVKYHDKKSDADMKLWLRK
jgi:serine/threonine protein kinase